MPASKKHHIVCVIPARGGNNGIPNKNLRRFAGKPLIAWAILEALASKHLSRVIVSTNDRNIAKTAKRYGAEVIWRPDEFATATVGIEPTLRHVFEALKKSGYIADGIALTMATNPLRRTSHINEAIGKFLSSRADSVVSVNETPANHTPYWTLVQSRTGKVSLFDGKPLKKILTRRQDFPKKCLARNDLIYVLKPKNLYERKPNLYGKRVMLYETSPLFDADINTPEEWHDAEIKFKRLQKTG